MLLERRLLKPLEGLASGTDRSWQHLPEAPASPGGGWCWKLQVFGNWMRPLEGRGGLEAPGSPWRPAAPPRRTPPGTWPFVGATVPLAVGRQASDLDRPAPSMSRGISAAHHRRWAAYAMSLGFRV